MTNFEEVSGKKKGGSYTYEPGKEKVKSPMEGHSGERLTKYYGMIATPVAVEEIKAWAEVLKAITNGIPKPFDNTIIIDKIVRYERKYGEDFSDLKKCCPPSAEVREAKELKPFIFAILERIVEIGGIQKYVEKHE